jgi:hypothetical protein
MAAEQKRIAINKFILADLFSGDNPTGLSFREKEKGIFYYFDNTEKWLMDIEGIDFYCFLRDRYDISKREKDEILDAIITKTWNSKNEVTAHRLTYFDEKNFILYFSDHNNGVFKIDGDKIEHVDNGSDGVFFEFNSDFTPFKVDVNNLEGINYFERSITTISKKRIEKLLRFELTKWPKMQKKDGFNWNKFRDEKSCVREFLIDRTNFAQGEENTLFIEEQKYLLLIYFYSLFFESIQKEKPIACFVGRKESGKSFIATSIGKILFGDNFQSRNTPDDIKDLITIMGENYYMVFDNLDHYLKHKMIDAICNTATGIEIARRKLYTDSGPVSIGKRLSNIKDEIEEVFDFSVEVGNHNVKYYTFEPKKEIIEPEVIEHAIEEVAKKSIPKEISGSQPYLLDQEVQIKFLKAGIMGMDEEKLLSLLMDKEKNGPLDPFGKSLIERKEMVNKIRKRAEEAKNSRFKKPN